jgi:hypothetical protein
MTRTTAAVASAAAGLVHAAAAGSHAGDHRALAVAFGVTALLQLAWAALVWQRGTTNTTVAAGLLLHSAAVGAWAVSRTAGIGWFPGLEQAEPIGLQDTTAVALEGLAVFAAFVGLARPAPAAAARGRAAAVVGTLVFVAALPAMTTPHPHHGTGTDDGHGHELAAGPSARSGAEHRATERLPDVPGVTAAQRERAAKLVADTERSLTRFTTVAAAEAAGYRSIGDGITGFEHFVNAAYLANDTIVDPQQPESLVFEVEPDGTRTLASAMYILPPGRTMADVPDIAGPMTQWHDHQNLCWDASGVRLAGILVNGRCTPAGTFRPTPPMLHVWVVDNECGPFAGIEGSAHTGACFAPHPHGGD